MEKGGIKYEWSPQAEDEFIDGFGWSAEQWGWSLGGVYVEYVYEWYEEYNEHSIFPTGYKVSVGDKKIGVYKRKDEAFRVAEEILDKMEVWA